MRCLARVALPLLAVLSVLLPGCSRGPSEADAIRALIRATEAHANEGDSDAIAAVVAADYADKQGRDKAALMRRVERPMGAHRRRYVHARVQEIDVDGETASAQLLVAMAGRRITADDDLLAVSSRLLMTTLTLRKEGARWLVTSASWRRPAPLELL